MNHQTRDIYAFNLLHSTKLETSSDFSYLISRLVDIDNKQTSGQSTTLDFARQVIETYDSSVTGFGVDRVCLSFCSPFSRKLTIVSSHNTNSDGVENLVPGYHCYVSPDSSLFAVPFGGTEFGRVRVYSDIQKVIGSFTSRNLPIQRTIGKLAAAGFRSGISISLALGDWGTGLLFLNSKTVGAFDSFEDSDYLATCILRMVANATLMRSKFNPKCIDPQLIASLSCLDQISNLCIPSVFAEQLAKGVLIRFGARLDIETQSCLQRPFFYPSQTAILLTLKAMEFLRFDDLATVKIAFSAIEPDFMQLQIDFDIRQAKQVGHSPLALSSLAESLGFEISLNENGLVLTTQYQTPNDAELKCGYSTTC